MSASENEQCAANEIQRAAALRTGLHRSVRPSLAQHLNSFFVYVGIVLARGARSHPERNKARSKLTTLQCLLFIASAECCTILNVF